MVVLKIADMTGHREIMMEPEQVMDFINREHQNSWVFVNGVLVQPDNINYNEVEQVDIMPPMIGGASLKEINWANRLKYLTHAERTELRLLKEAKED